MKRVVVVGPPGSGKSTLAQLLADRMGCEHVELDGLWWDPGWREAGPDVFRERLEPVVAGDRWVLSGNYNGAGAREVAWPRADTIVWLDLRRRVTMPRVVRRTFRRAVSREDLWGTGNRESLKVLTSQSIVLFAWRAHPSYKRYEGLDRDPGLAHLTWVRLRTTREVRRWLSSSFGG